MNKRMTQLFALMAASVVWNFSTASPAQLPQYLAPAYAPASSPSGIASFRPNYRFSPQLARQRASAPARENGWSYQSYPGRGARSWPFPVSYQPVVTPWQGNHYYQALAGGYRPYQPAMPMPWMVNPGSRMGQRLIPAYPAMLWQPMRYGHLAGFPWGNTPVASSYPAYYRAPAPGQAQNSFQRPDRRYIRSQFAANNTRFRFAPLPQRYAPVASSNPTYSRAPAPGQTQNLFQRPDRRYIRSQFAANNTRFRPAQQPQRYAPVASSYPTYSRAPAPGQAQNLSQRPDRRYIRGQFAANNTRFRQTQQPQRHAPVASSYPTYSLVPAPVQAQNPFQRPDRRYIRSQFAANNTRFRPAQQPQRYAPVASSYPAYNRAPAPGQDQNLSQRPDRRYIRGQFAANNTRFRQTQQPQRHAPPSYIGSRGMAYRFRPASPAYPMPLKSAPAAVTQLQPRTPYANPVAQWQKRASYRAPAFQFRPDPRLVQAPQSILPEAPTNERQLTSPGYGKLFQQTEKGVANGLVWRPLRGDALAGDMQNEKATYQ